MDITVVGGGIAGITSALLLAEDHQVTLVENSHTIGGLLKSRRLSNGYDFDFGAHVPRLTGVEGLDKLLFGDLDNEKWNEFEYLKVGNYFKGELNKSSQFINAELLGEHENNKGFIQLLNTTPRGDQDVISAKEYLDNNFGKIYAEKIFEPILSKLYGESLSDLHSNAHKLFGYSRLICGSQLLTSRLKEIQLYDEKIANTSNDIGASSKKSMYPKVQGIQQWIDVLERKLQCKGVDVRKGNQIESIQIGNEENSHKIKLSSEKILHSDLVVWAAPPNTLLNIIGKPEKVLSNNIYHRSVGLYDFQFANPFNVDNHYIYCNNPQMSTFRVTVYSNLTGSKANTCTVEVVGEYEEIQNLGIGVILEELKTMGIICSQNKLLFSNKQVFKKGFPVVKRDYYSNIRKMESIAKESLSEIMFVGRNSNSFFMEDILRELYHELIKRKLVN